MSKLSNQKGFSLPVFWILIFIGLIAFLSYRYSWWWLGAFAALYFGIIIVSIFIHGKPDGKKDEWLQCLSGPLYGLYHIENLEQSSKGGYLYDIVPEFKDKYKTEEQEEIVKSIERAIADPDIDFDAVLPNLPFSREEIKIYLKETLIRLKDAG